MDEHELRLIHRKMDAKQRVIPLWLREIGHFVGWAIFFYVVAYGLEGYLTTGEYLFARLAATVLAVWLTIRLELKEYRAHRQSKLKTVLDILAKVPGLIFASATVGWWNEWVS